MPVAASNPDDHIDWAGIRAAAIALNSVNRAAEQAARHLPTNEAERLRERINKRAYRERWMDKANASKTVILPKDKPLSKTVQSGSDIISDTLAEDAKATRLHLSAAARKGAKAASEMEGLDVVASSDKILNVGKLASLTHGWNEQGSGSVAVNLLCQNVENLQINAES